MQPQRSLIARILISPDEKRLRAGWRLLAHLLIFTAFLITLTIAWLTLTALAGNPSSFGFAENQILTAAALTFSIAIARRLLDRRDFASLGLQLDRRTLKDLLAGFMIAAMMMLLIYALERLAGWLTVTEVVWQDGFSSSEWLGLGTVLVVFVVVGWQEELYFRGYLLQNLRDGLTLFWAVGLSSALFGLAHIQNPSWSWMGLAGITLAGVFMAFGWLPYRPVVAADRAAHRLEFLRRTRARLSGERNVHLPADPDSGERPRAVYRRQFRPGGRVGAASGARDGRPAGLALYPRSRSF